MKELTDEKYLLVTKFISLDLQEKLRLTTASFYKKNKERVDKHHNMRVASQFDAAVGYVVELMWVLCACGCDGGEKNVLEMVKSEIEIQFNDRSFVHDITEK